MKRLIPTLLLLSAVVLGCTTGVSEKKSTDFHNMEQKVNNEALKNKPLPPGDGPER